MGVRDGVTFAVFAAALASVVVGSVAIWRSGRASGALVPITAPFVFATLGLFSTVFGPLFLVPALAGAAAVAFTVSQRASWRLRGLVNVCSTLSVLVPFGLQELGVMPPTHRFVDGTVQLLPHLVELPPLPTSVLLVFLALFVVLVPNILVGRAIEALDRAERRRILLTHRLRALLPG